jgi:hypothetical protein
LYCAAIVSPALLYIIRDYSGPYPFRRPLGALLIFILAASLVVFTAASPTRFPQPAGSWPINETLVAWLSIVLYVIALVLSLTVAMVEIMRLPYDLKREEDEQVDKLAERFRDVRITNE